MTNDRRCGWWHNGSLEIGGSATLCHRPILPRAGRLQLVVRPLARIASKFRIAKQGGESTLKSGLRPFSRHVFQSSSATELKRLRLSAMNKLAEPG
jgi:hypothetical protein